MAETSASMWPLQRKSIALQMREARRADLALVRLVAAVGDEIDAELALGRLDRGINLAGRHVIALGVELEVVDQRFHRALHLGALGRHDLVVVDRDRALPVRAAQFFDALLHDAHRLAHLFHADAVAVVAVAVLADRNVEFEFGIAFVRLRPAQIPGRARAAHHHAGEAPVPGILQLDHADIDVALLEDAVAGEQAVEIVDHLQERIAERADVVDQLRRQILMHAAGPEIGRVHARARGALVEHHQLFALLEAPQRRRERADVHRLRGDVEQMRQQPADLGIEHADQLRALRHLDARAAFRPPGRRRAPGSSARRNRAGRNTAPPADRSCARSASRCRGAEGRYADRRARRFRRRAPAPGAARRAPPDAAARN